MPEDREQGWAGALAALAARRYLAWSLVVTLAAMLAFVVPAWRRAGMPPAPLDDTFIYYGHARSWALGHPFAWY
ncbi:MAG: hypothetical protein KC731_42275, partial [Myxococcales bacterium]|nr:hypothetical protein [Myxococcales bacterium]